MSTTVAVPDWIKKIGDDERRRDSARLKEDEIAARKAALVQSNGRRLVDEIRATVIRDVELFRSEFAGDATRDIVIETTGFEGGFVVRKPAPGAVSLSVTPKLESAAIACHYRFTLTNGFPPREDRIGLNLAGDDGETLQIKHHGSGQVLSVDALSEFLLVPVFTGRPR
jgi:hypothetical protein